MDKLDSAAPRQPEGPQAPVAVEGRPGRCDHCHWFLPKHQRDCIYFPHPVSKSEPEGPQDLSEEELASLNKHLYGDRCRCVDYVEECRKAVAELYRHRAQPAVSRADADPSADAPLDALKDLLDQVAPNDGTACALCGDKGDSNCCLHVAAARAALAAAPRDERGPGMAQCWCGAGMAPEHEGPHLAAAAAPLGAPVARLDEVREAVLAERKKWVDALNGTCDRCLRSAANTLTDDDSEAGEFLDCARCGTALRDLVTGVEPIPKSAPEKQSPAPAAKMDGR